MRIYVELLGLLGSNCMEFHQNIDCYLQKSENSVILLNAIVRICCSLNNECRNGIPFS